MAPRLAAAAAVGAVLVTAPVLPAHAATKKKPITKTYTATAATPDPSNEAGTNDYGVCAQNVPGSFDKRTFKAPAAGKLKVTVSGIIGDWDLLITNAEDSEVGNSGSGGYGTPVAPSTEATSVKIKKKGTYHIIACNWAGGPTATVKYVFTYA
jgi:hypothetical protein